MDKYLVISSEFPPGPGGIGKHAYSLIKSMVKYNCAVDVICDMDYATDKEIADFIAAQPQSINIFRIKRRGKFTYLDRIQTSLSFAKKNNYKKVIVTGKFPIWIGGIIKLMLGGKVKVECFIHGSEAKLSSGLQAKLLHACLKRMDKIWAVSRFTKSLLPADIEQKNTTGLLPNGLNIEDWPGRRSVNPLKWPGFPRLLTVGSISPRKGQHCVVKALPALIASYPEAHYHIVGLAKNAPRIEQLARELGVEKHITIHGKLSQDDLVKAYESADIFCMLSENQATGEVEGFGIAILEANIMSLPVIGSKGCGIEDAIENGYNGYLVDNADSAAFTDAVSHLLNADPAILQQNCLAWAKKHDWDLLAKEII